MVSFFPEKIKHICLEAGFDLVGFTKAELPETDKEYLKNWVRSGLHGKMSWFAKEVSMEIRLELKHLGFIPESIICLGLLYNSEESETVLAQMPVKVSRYALGEDYHDVIREKAKPILAYLRKEYPNYKFRQSVDSLPIPEKIFSKMAGLGWIGKNTNLIHPELGSYFFLSTILTDSPWETGEITPTNHCGSCRACLDACPTGALFAPYQIDAGKCISHHTIENRDPSFGAGIKLNSWAYGCDICQEVCPWNHRKARRNGIVTKVNEFLPKEIFASDSTKILSEMNEATFNEHFSKSPINRIGNSIWNRNLNKVADEC